MRLIFILFEAGIISFASSQYYSFKFKKSDFSGEVTLSDMMVDDVANNKAEFISAALDRLFSPAIIDLKSVHISKLCVDSLEYLKESWAILAACGNKACKERHRWVRTVHDAQGRRPSGVEFGNHYWLGAYHQCYSVKISTSNGNGGNFYGKYCKAKISTKAIEDVYVGICVPQQCSTSDVFKFVSKYSNVTDFSIACDKPMRIGEDIPALVAITVFCIIGAVLVLGTVLDYQLLCKYLAAESNRSRDVETVLLTGLHIKGESGLCRILLCFSPLSNGCKLITLTKIPGQIDCMHGMRAIAFLHQMLIHSMFILWSVDNFALAFKQNAAAKSVMTLGFTTTDTFFFLGGVSVSYNWFKEVSGSSKENNLNNYSYWFRFYVHRYFRVTAPYLMVLWYYSILYIYTGSGPMWPSENHQCNGSLWPNLFYLNNYILSPCMEWTWYIAADTQLYSLSPILLVLLFKSRQIGFSVSGALILTCSILRGVVCAIHDFPPNMQPGFTSHGGITGHWSSVRFFGFRTEYRCDAYIVGLLLGYIITHSDFNPKVRQDRKIRIIAQWICTSFAFVVHAFAPYFYEPLSPVVNGLYSGISRTAWAIFVAWVIYGCVSGNSKYVNYILSWKYWLPVSRLSYCGYLIHPIVYYFLVDSADVPLHFESHLTIVYVFVNCCFITFLLSTVVTLAFEMPILELNKLLVKRREPCKSYGIVHAKERIS